MKLAAVPLTWHQRVVFDDRLLKHSHVSLTGLDCRGDHGLVLNCGVVLSDGCGRRTVERTRAPARRRVVAASRLRRAIGIPGGRNPSEDGRRYLAVLFLLNEHFIR